MLTSLRFSEHWLNTLTVYSNCLQVLNTSILIEKLGADIPLQKKNNDKNKSKVYSVTRANERENDGLSSVLALL
jgi:hypothetical protein